MQQKLGQRRDIDRRQTETSHHNTGHQTGLGRRKPFDRRRGGGRVAETKAGAGQHAEADDPADKTGGKTEQDKARPNQQAADQGGLGRTDLVLGLAGNDHGKGEHETADRVGCAHRRYLPLEGSRPAGLDGADNGLLKDTPGVQHPQGQVDAGTGNHHLPSFAFVWILV